MALVTYDTSDVSDDDEGEVVASTKSVITSNIAQSQIRDSVSIINKKTHESANEPEPSNLGLPKPKQVVKDLTEDDLEDIVKPKDAELALREKPPIRAATKTKIVIPSLPAYDSDEEGSAAKKPKKAAAGHGLFDLLPAPKGAVSTTSLVPQNVAKKVSATSSAASSSASTSAASSYRPPSFAVGGSSLVNANTDNHDSDYSDDEGGDGSFFSLGSLKAPSKLILPAPAPTVNLANLRGEQSGVAMSSRMLSDAPLQFRSAGPSISWPAPSGMHAAEEEEVDNGEDDNEDDSDDDGETGFGGPQFQHMEDAPSLESANSEQLMRLLGRRNLGKEAINFVDVHADDHLDPLSIVKNLTEETVVVSHSKKNKDQLPSVQKRKHQITWLAHKAKEQELELKQQWSENRMTKKQTQSKYGF